MRSEGAGSDVWGGLAASLVALPSALAFGVTVYGPLGPDWAGAGAMAGLVGAGLLGLIAPLSNGAPRLITAPCAPAAAVMGALAATLAAKGLGPGRVVALLGLTALLSAGFQLGFGLLRGGRLIKFIPYPVVTGYLSGVAIIIFLAQCPKLLGVPAGAGLWKALLAPATWNLAGVGVGVAAMAAMVFGPRFVRSLPGPILGLGGGLAAYAACAAFDPALRALEGNTLVVGALSAGGGGAGLTERLKGLLDVTAADLPLILNPAMTLAVLLSIDTLKTCVVVDALTKSRHDSDRTLLGQGAANAVCALAGGIPGAGTMGATLVNVTSGGTTRLSGVLCGVFSLAAFLLLSRLIAWVPTPALAGILLVVAARMYDRKSFRLLRRRSTLTDFAVGTAVVVVAVGTGLIAAAGVGLALSIVLFIHDQIQASVIRRRSDGTTTFSRRRHTPEERAALERLGTRTVVCELQGNLFFGTTDQLFSELEPDLKTIQFLILDMRRVASVDFTAVHMLKQIEDYLHDHGGHLLISRAPTSLPTGVDLQRYLDELGLVKAKRNVELCPTLDDALTRAEDALLAEAGFPPHVSAAPLDLADVDLMREVAPDQLAAMRSVARALTLKAGQHAFRRGDEGDEVYLMRRGTVRVELPLKVGAPHHLTTFRRGDFFGEVVFLDRGRRTADAVALADSELYVVSRKDFDALAREHAALGVKVFARLAKTLAVRLRQADAEMTVLKEA